MDVWFHTYGQGYAPPGWLVHSLPYTNRLYVVLGGSAYFLHEQGEKRLQPGFVYLFPHRLPFRVRQDENDRVNHLYFDFMLAPPLLGESLVEIPIQPDSMIDHTVACLLRCVPGQKDDAPLVYAYFENLLRLVLRQSGLNMPNDPRMADVLRYIHENDCRSLGDDALAQIAHLEKNHFIRVFSRATGMTPYQYLRQYRLNRAVTLLMSGKTVAEAAAQCGYESASALSHAMRKSRHCSPRQLQNTKADEARCAPPASIHR